ncbi:hypothetical protein SUGI_0262260 [Cryptomeria japonica]|nr:hypothetical protein SUGI_0262260 [Cryptomeria japonica]
MGGRKDGRKKVGTESSGSLSQSIYASGTATAEGAMGVASLAIGSASTACFAFGDTIGGSGARSGIATVYTESTTPSTYSTGSSASMASPSTSRSTALTSESTDSTESIASSTAAGPVTGTVASGSTVVGSADTNVGLATYPVADLIYLCYWTRCCLYY